MILHSDGDNTNFSSIKHHNLYRENQLYHKNTILAKITGSIFGHCSWKSSRSWKVFPSSARTFQLLIQSKEPVKLSKGIGNRLSLIWHSESTGPKINLKRSIRTENIFGSKKIRFMRISGGPTGPAIPEPFR